jgi:hypothetical protein
MYSDDRRSNLMGNIEPTIGSTKDWFPSRRSVASHLGGFSIVLEGHCRFGRLMGLNGLYFLDGSLSLER